MGRIMNMLMLSCKKATSLIEKRSLIGLSFKEKVQLKMHKSMCDACSNYEKQSSTIDNLLQNQRTNPENAPLIKNEELKEKIINSLQ